MDMDESFSAIRYWPRAIGIWLLAIGQNRELPLAENHAMHCFV